MSSEPGSEQHAVGPQMVIWGTDVVVSHCKDKFKQFVQTYVEQDITDDEKFDGMDITEPLYLQRLEEVLYTQGSHRSLKRIIVFVL